VVVDVLVDELVGSEVDAGLVELLDDEVVVLDEVRLLVEELVGRDVDDEVLVVELVELLVDEVVGRDVDDDVVVLDEVELLVEELVGRDVDDEVLVLDEVLVVELVELLVDEVVGRDVDDEVLVVELLVLELVDLLDDEVVGSEVEDEVLVLELLVEDVVVDVVVLEVVVVAACSTSTDPMSHAVPLGRATPRWSVTGHPGPTAMSIAGLPSAGRNVFVRPPLEASAPSEGDVELWSPVPASPHVSSLDRFAPLDVTVPSQLPPPAAARIVPRSVADPPAT